MTIRDELVEKRRKRLAQWGPDEGFLIPQERGEDTPLVPFLHNRGLIAEIKRSSPSEGAINATLDPVSQATYYRESGIQNISVLTIPEGFSGSLTDLLMIKRAHPTLSILRKDFIEEESSIDAAYRAGADAVLLIAGMLSYERLQAMHTYAESRGLAALVEVHTPEDVDKARRFRPTLVGINSRDLQTFAIDALLPLRIRSLIDWDAKVVYESGISSATAAEWVASSNFYGLLVGTAAVRHKGLVKEMQESFLAASEGKKYRFWPELSRRLQEGKKPLVKICGLTREEDARLAYELGADLLGFVFYPPSPRKASTDIVRKVKDIPALKVGVIIEREEDAILQEEVRILLHEGVLDAIQFHGKASTTTQARLAEGFPYYSVMRKNEADRRGEGPRVLLDVATDTSGAGGTGIPIDSETLSTWKGPLWIAGGLTPESVLGIIQQWSPELIDVASGIEASPGIKDVEKMKRFMKNTIGNTK